MKWTLLTLIISLIGNTIAMAETLTPQQQALIPVAAFTANGNIAKLEPALNQALDAGMTVNEVREVLVQMYAYAGFPRTLNGINTMIAVLEKRKASGIKDVIGKEASPLPADMDKNAYGNTVRNELTGQDLTQNPAAYAQFAPVVDDFLKEHLFADIFARDVLSRQERELATISALAALPGTDAQLTSHLKITLHTGLSQDQLEGYVAVLRQQVSAASAMRAQALLDKAQPNPPTRVTTMDITKTTTTKPEAAPADYFTGKVTLGSRFASGEANSYGGAVVNFQPGARTAWHTHPLGQTLVIISGHGRYQAEGKPVQDMNPGDVIWIPTGIKHWHGAGPHSAMSHVAIAETVEGSSVTWLEKVTEEQYAK
jgi:quercetin dioxygenase-like cupin family protein/alkylhydroperoxidase/carboxymuconolactone decarboxylase family protein YurZ